MESLCSNYGGFNCTPVDENSIHCCAICRSAIIKEPEITVCCRNRFCGSCLSRWRATSPGCPLCRTTPLMSVRDSSGERAMLKLRVFCQHREQGCTWTGSLSEHGPHVVQDCQFGLVECPVGCGSILVRGELRSHADLQCSLRHVRCTYCGVEGTHDFITLSHELICPYRSIRCPNGCESAQEIRQGDLPSHLQACPLEPTPCRFVAVGCDARTRRCDMESHVASSRDAHLLLMLEKMVAMKRALDANQEEIKFLRNALRILQLDAEKAERLRSSAVPRLSPPPPNLQQLVDCSRAEPFMPVFLKMGNFSLQQDKGGCWHSRPFYTSPGGYKLCLGVYPSGCEDGQGTHLSVYMYVMGGEFDDNLEWPMKCNIIVVLHNQLSNSHPVQADCSFTELLAGNRVIELDTISTKGSGMARFHLISRLGHDSQRHTQYLKDNCLFFEVY